MINKQQLKTPLLYSLFAFGKLRSCHAPAPPLELERINKILILQLGGIGDVMLTFPVLRALRLAFPEKKLSTLTEYGDWLFTLAPDLKEGIAHNQIDMSAGYRKKLQQIKKCCSSGIDLVISTARGDGSVESSVVAWLTHAKFRIGFSQEGSQFLYTHVKAFSYHTPLLMQNIGLLELCALQANNCSIGLRLPEDAEKEGRLCLEKRGLHSGPLVTIHPFAGNFARLKSWPIKRYAQLAEELIHKFSANILVLGSRKDRDLWERNCPGSLKEKVKNLCGELSFSGTASIIKQSDLFVGNDSSLLHIAEDFGTQSICIFGATSPAQILPKEHNTEAIIHQTPCRPCYLHQPLHRQTCNNDVKCLTGISVNDVLRRVSLRLAAHRESREKCALQ